MNKRWVICHNIFWGIEEIEFYRELKKYFLMSDGTKLFKDGGGDYSIVKEKEEAVRRYTKIVEREIKSHKSQVTFYENLMADIAKGNYNHEKE